MSIADKNPKNNPLVQVAYRIGNESCNVLTLIDVAYVFYQHHFLQMARVGCAVGCDLWGASCAPFLPADIWLYSFIVDNVVM